MTEEPKISKKAVAIEIYNNNKKRKRLLITTLISIFLFYGIDKINTIAGIIILFIPLAILSYIIFAEQKQNVYLEQKYFLKK